MARKLIGQPKTEGEKDIETAIKNVPQWQEQGQGKTIEYEPVGGGISNANWRVFIEGDERSYFVKIPGRGTEMFVDRDAAHDAAVKAYRAGVSAEPVHYDDKTGVEVFVFIDGLRTSTNGDFLNQTVRVNAVRSLRTFNDGEGLVLTKTIFDMIDEHFEQIERLQGHVPRDFDTLKSKYLEARSALEASGLDLVPCMNDTLAGNFLLDHNNNVTLVDFEYASNNDRFFEMALWFGEMFFPAQIESELLEEYFGRVDEGIIARISLFKALADIKWSSWAMVQNKVSALDFDFFKYGVWKHLRARSLAYSDQWDKWLKNV